MNQSWFWNQFAGSFTAGSTRYDSTGSSAAMGSSARMGEVGPPTWTSTTYLPACRSAISFGMAWLPSLPVYSTRICGYVC
jgi:hypothetical protein